jgi:chromosome segregation ATPase
MADPKEKNRLENIMQIDTTSLLKELKSLEHSFTEYQRQDAVPGWATSILPRLEFLERVSEGARDRAEITDLDQLDAEDVLMAKIRHEVETRTMALKLAFDAKSSASALEIDRLHKLLYIRPTTSELQEVVHSVRQVSKRTDNIINDLGDQVQGLVSVKLTEEMTTLMDRLKAAEEHGDRAVAVVVVRVDEIESELRKVRTGVKSELDSKEKILETLKTDTVMLQEDAGKLRALLKKLSEETRQSIDDLGITQANASEQFTDFETATNERIEIVEENITACDEMIRDEVGRADERYDELTAAIAGLTTAFDEFRTNYSNDMERIQTTSDAISELLNKTVERQNTIMHYMESLQQFEVTAKITKNADNIDSIRRENELLEESINTVRLSVVEVKKELDGTNEELSDVPNKINVETMKIEANQKDIAQVKESLKYTKTMIQDQANQLEDLSLLKEQVLSLVLKK